MILSSVIFTLSVIAFNHCKCDNAAVAVKNKKIELPCGHSHEAGEILTVWWQVNNVENPAVTYKPGEPLAVYDPKLERRVGISFPAGDLTVDPVQWDDAGTYKCFITFTDGRVAGYENYRLTVNVVPDKVVMNCSDTKSSPPNRPCSQVQSIFSISCSAESSPKSRIVWPTKPAGCKEAESNFCTAGDQPSVCVSELEEVCAGEYACRVEYDDNIIMKTLPGAVITVSERAPAGSTGEKETLKVALITVIVVVLLAVIIVCVTILLAKRYCVNGNRQEQPKSCFQAMYAPCHCTEIPESRHGSPVKNHRDAPEQIPLHVNEPNRSISDHDSSEEDNPTNTIQERKTVRPEILQAIEAAKSLADAPAASRVNFMVTTIGGTKYKFDIEKDNKPSHSRSGSVDNFDGASDRDVKTRSIKGPLIPEKPKIEVDDVD